MKISMKLPVKLLAILILALPFSVPAAPDDEQYGQADLDQMLAPIALYPDSVLSQVLIASTYPLEVAQAARWSRQHSRLKGEDAVEAVEDKDWDISVKALVAFPEILDRMDEDLDWTQRLGEAFLAQEGEVMDRVQLLRQRAHDAGNLDSNEQVRVVREREIIYIEPAYRHRIFVPYYDPWVIYGNWWWPAYPPYCWSTWGGHSARYYNSYSPSYYWGVGFNVSPVFYFSGFHWRNRHVVVFSNRHRNSNWNYSAREFHRQRDTQRWQHDTRHRRGVDYRSERLSQDHGRMRRDAVQREQRLSRQPSSTNRRESQREGTQEQRDQRDNPQRSNRSRRAEPARSESPVREESQRNSQRHDADRRAKEPRQERRSRAERGEQTENPGRENQAEERERSPHSGNNRGDESQRGGSRRQSQSSRRTEPTRSEPQSREESQPNSERHAADRRANEPRQERRSGAERDEPSENSAREYRTGERERNPQSGNNRGEERQKGDRRHRSER